ncbi:predicted protein [Coccidioides posadasii str. Silveira]|uniref:Predicted protein n=1 Tax=Coccidioides posadasii (strain RMSCC 757 / Silveira) TaxID=443226 RepID=E9CYJ2_COCPS|nr:predicted protein [Coccidioides posadasii str. Silveira]
MRIPRTRRGSIRHIGWDYRFSDVFKPPSDTSFILVATKSMLSGGDFGGMRACHRIENRAMRADPSFADE